MTSRTENQLAAGLAAIRARQSEDPDFPRPGAVSLRVIANAAGLSVATVARVEAIALAKLRAALLSANHPTNTRTK